MPGLLRSSRFSRDYVSRLSNHPNAADRALAQAWARAALDRDDCVILDTETTGFSGSSEVIQIGVLAAGGTPLLETLLRPLGPIPPEVVAVHGITTAHVAHAPCYAEVHARLAAAVAGRTVISYNAAFDARLLRQTAALFGLPEAIAPDRWECAMLHYARYRGELGRNGAYKWQKLPRGGSAAVAHHQAMDDCFLTLDLLRRMAAG